MLRGLILPVATFLFIECVCACLSVYALASDFDDSVPDSYKNIISHDLAALQAWPIGDGSKEVVQEIRNLLKLPEITGAPATSAAEVMRSWYSDRVQYYVGPTFEINARMTEIRSSYAYPNIGVAPWFSTGRQPAALANPQTLNLGLAIYLSGKSQGDLKGLYLNLVRDNGIVPELVEVTSPRVGVLQIFDELFLPWKQINGDPAQIESDANTIGRLSELLHDARHGDGNGQSLGFPHPRCPEGHSYAGLRACDAATNGSYAVSAASLKLLMQNCTKCSVAELEALKLRYLDLRNRQITATSDNILRGENTGEWQGDWNDQPEGS